MTQMGHQDQFRPPSRNGCCRIPKAAVVMAKSCSTFVEFGNRLIAVIGALDHGQWLPWLFDKYDRGSELAIGGARACRRRDGRKPPSAPRPARTISRNEADRLIVGHLCFVAPLFAPRTRPVKYTLAMKIYTSSWSTRLPPEIQKIGISRGTPRGYPAGYRRMIELAPGPWFNSVTPAEYHRRFMDQLGALDARAVLAKLHELGTGRDVALLCYEAPSKPADWCHRGHVAAWLHDQLGIEVFEFGLEEAGHGWRHPKLLPQFQRPA
jgi:hypothetical protein